MRDYVFAVSVALDLGVVFSISHVRGGGDFGRPCYNVTDRN